MELKERKLKNKRIRGQKKNVMRKERGRARERSGERGREKYKEEGEGGREKVKRVRKT